MSCAHGDNSHRNFSYNGLTVRVSSDDASHLSWLEEFLSPQFEIGDGSSHDCHVVLTVDIQQYEDILDRGPHPDGRLVDCFVLDGGLVRLPLWRSLGSEQSIFDQHRRVFYVVQQDNPEVTLLTPPNNMAARTALMRVVREFAMNHSHRTGRLIIHGSAFVVGGQGVIIAGPKRAGKTSLLIHVLLQGGAEYLSNDRVVVSFEEPGLVLRGMPTVVAVRQQVLEMFPMFRHRLLAGSYHPRFTISEVTHGQPRPMRPGSDGRFNLTPAQFCELLQVHPRAQGRLRALVFPRVTGKSGTIELGAVSAQEGAALLIDSLFGGHSSRKGSEVFALSGVGDRPDRFTLESVCFRLTSQIRCFECRLGEDAFQSGTSAAVLMGHVMGDP